MNFKNGTFLHRVAMLDLAGFGCATPHLLLVVDCGLDQLEEATSESATSRGGFARRIRKLRTLPIAERRNRKTEPVVFPPPSLYCLSPLSLSTLSILFFPPSISFSLSLSRPFPIPLPYSHSLGLSPFPFSPLVGWPAPVL